IRGHGQSVRTGSGMSAGDGTRMRRRWGRRRFTPGMEGEPQFDALVPSRSLDGERPLEPGVQEEDDLPVVGLEGAWSVLRRGVQQSPELRAGFGYTLLLAAAL